MFGNRQFRKFNLATMFLVASTFGCAFSNVPIVHAQLVDARPTAAASQPSGPAAPTLSAKAWRQANVLSLRVEGPLDSLAIARECQAIVEKHRAAGFDVLVVELTGRQWRADVLHALATALRSGAPGGLQAEAPGGGTSRPIRTPASPEAPGRPGQSISPTAGQGTGMQLFVLLQGTQDQVGGGQAAIGVLADAAYIVPRGRIVHVASDELSNLVPSSVDQELTDRELRGWMWSSLQDRAGDALVTTLVPRPTAPAWVSQADQTPDSRATESARLLSAPPIGEKAVGPIGASGELSIDAPLAKRIGLVAGTARTTSEVLAQQGVRARKLERELVRSGLAGARESLQRGVRCIDEARRQAGALLDSVARLRGTDAPPKQNSAGEKALPSVELAENALHELEHLVQEFPELLRQPPPGTTAINQTPQTIDTAWRQFFQTRRVDLERLRDKAKTLAEKRFGSP